MLLGMDNRLGRLLFYGNAVVDHLAGLAAKDAQLPTAYADGGGQLYQEGRAGP